MMSDIRLNIHEAKTDLSRHLDAMEEADRIILCNQNRPIAEVRLLPSEPTDRRQLGLAKGQIEVLDSFFEPLPDELLDSFEGVQ